MTMLAFSLELRQIAGLTKVLMLCQRLGGQVKYLSATDLTAKLVLAAPSDAAHRFAPQFRRILDVTELTELHSSYAAQARAM